MVSQEDKSQAMLMWILTIFIGWVSGLIFYFVAKDKPFVFRHAAQSLAFSICFFVVQIILFVTVVGIILVPVLWIVALIFCIMAAMKAKEGEPYDVPGSTALAKAMFKV